MKNRFQTLIAPLLVSAFLISGCASNTVSRIAPFSAAKVKIEAGLTPQENEDVVKNCPFGEPKLEETSNVGPTDFIARDGYVLMHSAVDKIPLWVCEFVVKDQLTGSLNRDDKFQPDPLLKKGRRAELIDYKSSGYPSTTIIIPHWRQQEFPMGHESCGMKADGIPGWWSGVRRA
jgi:DNA/RNA endonuclease G (NUC1)